MLDLPRPWGRRWCGAWGGSVCRAPGRRDLAGRDGCGRSAGPSPSVPNRCCGAAQTGLDAGATV
eukprot:959343-Pyramimonas_sp.AAC.1